ncbi:MAG TPA: hypothetical protein PK142_00875 [bacterium]|nr:hypothetical protein [bacterium]
MKDSIEKNLEFKTFLFVTLTGSWIWIINNYLSLVPLNDKNSLFSFLMVVFSYIVFYPALILAIMLVYSSVYQAEEDEEKIKELEIRYKKYSILFFNWWPATIIMAPALFVVSIISSLQGLIVLIITFLLVLIVWRKFFKKIFTWKDIEGFYKKFLRSFFVYCFFFCFFNLFCLVF